MPTFQNALPNLKNVLSKKLPSKVSKYASSNSILSAPSSLTIAAVSEPLNFSPTSELIINSDSPICNPSLPLSPSCAVPNPLGETSPLLVKEVYLPFNTASMLKLLSSL